jgi:hypothetical protein
VRVWEIEFTDQFEVWYLGLTEEQAGAVDGRVDLVMERGPVLGRPVVDGIKGSRHHNMKELRCSKDGALRVLFVFDPLRNAILLLGGNKSEDSAWATWYQTAVPQADDLYDDHLQELREEGLIP